MPRYLLLITCLLSSGCELVSGLSELTFTDGSGGATSSVGGSGGTSSSVGGSGGSGGSSTATGGGGSGGSSTATGGGGSGGGPATAVDAVFGSFDRRTCARRGDTFYCWGSTETGPVGTPASSTFPVGTTFVLPGFYNNCVVAADELQCWGTWNYSGELGVGDTNAHVVPQVVPVPTPVASASVGNSTMCALGGTPTTLYCWGDSSYGQVVYPGDGDAHPSPTAVTIPGSGDLRAVGHGTYFACAQRDADVYCWGHNQQGTLGIGIDDLLDHPPTKIATTEPASEIAIYGDGGCFVSTAGLAYCWGIRFDDAAQVVRVPALDGTSSLHAGWGHVCGLRGTQVVCAGANSQYQLGYANVGIADNVVDVPGGAAAVACGFEHTCALTLDGAVYCWGDNSGGALGFGSTAALRYAAPQKVLIPAP